MVCDERTGRCTAGDRLENRSLYFDVSSSVEVLSHRVVHLGALEEDFLNSVVHDKVYIATAVAHLGVIEGIICHAVLNLHDRKRAEALAEHSELLRMH